MCWRCSRAAICWRRKAECWGREANCARADRRDTGDLARCWERGRNCRGRDAGCWRRAVAGVLLVAETAPSGGLRRRARLSAHLTAKQWEQEARKMGCGRLPRSCSWQGQLPLAACAAVRASWVSGRGRRGHGGARGRDRCGRGRGEEEKRGGMEGTEEERRGRREGGEVTVAPPCAPQRTLESEAMGARSEKDGMWAAAAVLLVQGQFPLAACAAVRASAHT